MGEVEERFPLFPLGLVMLPSEVVPLHIFEDRYKLMIGECLERETEFGIVWLADDGLREVGCTAAVEQLLERMDDGRMNILVRGGRPFRLLRRIEDLPYPAGDVELLDDDPGDADEELAAETRASYAALVEHVTDERPDDGQLSELSAYGMAATIELSPDPKQALLEERSENARLRVVGELFGLALGRLEKAEEAQEAARSNGKVRF
ncbi:MAG TPA: LON peptidase substrate-binding domain-containing protein [Thermoleophilaceae bacterium]|nr:LON peptidase substrate-binding domain-containing protein [Thermoleophilaceae bacterium]